MYTTRLRLERHKIKKKEPFLMKTLQEIPYNLKPNIRKGTSTHHVTHAQGQPGNANYHRQN